jgi:hypothetical protein
MQDVRFSCRLSSSPLYSASTFAMSMSTTVTEPPAVEFRSESAFDKLVDDMAAVFHDRDDDPGSIDPGSIDHNSILNLMRLYQSTDEDWEPFVKLWQEDDKPYVRNIIHPGNSKYNLVCIAARPQHTN